MIEFSKEEIRFLKRGIDLLINVDSISLKEGNAILKKLQMVTEVKEDDLPITAPNIPLPPSATPDGWIGTWKSQAGVVVIFQKAIEIVDSKPKRIWLGFVELGTTTYFSKWNDTGNNYENAHFNLLEAIREKAS